MGDAIAHEILFALPDFSSLVETVMKLFFYGLVPRTAPSGRNAARREGRKRS
jgi:hypothetical protein